MTCFWDSYSKIIGERQSMLRGAFQLLLVLSLGSD